MATLTVYASANGGDLQSFSVTVGVAQAGSGSVGEHVNNAYARIGQQYDAVTYDIWEMFLEFDLSGITGGATINTAVLGLASNNGEDHVTPYIARFREYAYGATMEAADWVPAASLGATGTLRCHFDTTGGLAANDTYNDFTDDAMVALVTANIGSVIRLVGHSDRVQSLTTPTVVEWDYFGGPSYAFPPRLVIDYTPGAPPSTTGPAFTGGGFF